MVYVGRLRARGRVPVFEGDFHMEFCDNARQLLQAYFRDFTIERLERPWSAFTASWSRGACAKNLGLNASFVGDAYAYVLVRIISQSSSHQRCSHLTVKIHPSLT